MAANLAPLSSILPAGVNPRGMQSYAEHKRRIAAGEQPEVPPGQVSIKSLTAAFDEAIKHHMSLQGKDRVANSKRAENALAEHLGRNKDGKVRDLLITNGKLIKTQKGYEGGEPLKLADGKGVEAWGLALAPAYQEGKFNTCPNHASCKVHCLGKTSGQYHATGGGADLSEFKGPRLASLRRTIAMMRNPKDFAIKLNDEIEAHKRLAAKHGNHLGMRLNTLSDINPRVHKAIIEAHPDVTFYDYTKNNTNPIAPNHHYTYSSTGASQEGIHNENQNWKQMRRRLEEGKNVAMAFSDKDHLPQHVHDEETGKKYRVINGDEHDFRPVDEHGVIVGLRNKKITGKAAEAAKESHGFFVHYNPHIMREKDGKLIRKPSPGINPKTGKAIPGDSIPTVHHAVIPRQSESKPTLNNDNEVVSAGAGARRVM